MLKRYLHRIKENWAQEEGKIKYFIILLILLSFLLPVLIFKIYLLKDASALGDAVGGVLGTIISIIAALLVYITFKSQVKANENISTQINDERIYKLYELFNKELNIEYEEVIKDFSKQKEYIDKSLKNKTLNKILYENMVDIYEKIKNMNSESLERMKVICTTALKAANNKEEPFQKYLLDTMHKKLLPYMWYKQEKDLNVPFVKFETMNKEIERNTVFNISKFLTRPLKLLHIELFKGNDFRIKIELNVNIENDEDFVGVDFTDIEHNMFKIEWHILYQEILFTYCNDEEYSLN